MPYAQDDTAKKREANADAESRAAPLKMTAWGVRYEVTFAPKWTVGDAGPYKYITPCVVGEGVSLLQINDK